MKERVAWDNIIWKIMKLPSVFFCQRYPHCRMDCCALTGTWGLVVRIKFLHPKRYLGT